MNKTHSRIDSPIGTLLLVVAGGAVAGLYMTGHRPAPGPQLLGTEVPDAMPAARQQLAEYFNGGRTEFDLPLAARGTGFQELVWAELRKIPYGQTRSYAWIAEQIANPGAVRAVGSANARNPISIIVPCHRVVAANGDLTGYAGGIDRKRFLLQLEGALGGQDRLFG
ncbi:MAG: cysteine methyltransferase [Micrococcales bacterium]|nr:MAG: cysteine methyltransferase [Micrococcales bacterium]PIE28081.1 MAG: cysteine methyltransferase [Micrococcales bacterium]